MKGELPGRMRVRRKEGAVRPGKSAVYMMCAASGFVYSNQVCSAHELHEPILANTAQHTTAQHTQLHLWSHVSLSATLRSREKSDMLTDALQKRSSGSPISRKEFVK